MLLLLVTGCCGVTGVWRGVLSADHLCCWPPAAAALAAAGEPAAVPAAAPPATTAAIAASCSSVSFKLALRSCRDGAPCRRVTAAASLCWWATTPPPPCPPACCPPAPARVALLMPPGLGMGLMAGVVSVLVVLAMLPVLMRWESTRTRAAWRAAAKLAADSTSTSDDQRPAAGPPLLPAAIAAVPIPAAIKPAAVATPPGAVASPLPAAAGPPPLAPPEPAVVVAAGEEEEEAKEPAG